MRISETRHGEPGLATIELSVQGELLQPPRLRLAVRLLKCRKPTIVVELDRVEAAELCRSIAFLGGAMGVTESGGQQTD